MTTFAEIRNRSFAVSNTIRCLSKLNRYVRGGVVVEELIADIAIAQETFGIKAEEIGGGSC